MQDLVRTRQYVTKFIEMKSHLQGCALKMQTVSSHQAMADAMSSTATAMAKMNQAVNIPTIPRCYINLKKKMQRVK